MNSYSLGISGSWWLMVLLLVISVIFTIFVYYRTNPPVSKQKRGLLALLRSIALSLLIFAIFEPVLTGVRSKIINPKIAVMMDNSSSMNLDDAGGNRKSKYINAFKNSGIDQLNSAENIFRLFGEYSREIKILNFDSLSFKDNYTDLGKAVNSLYNYKDENLQAVVMFTDGAFNTGNNPLYAAEDLGIPFFTVGIGDSAEPRDISIQSLIMNEIAYIDNPVPINANITCIGFENEELNISVYDNDKLLETQKIIAANSSFESTVYFTYIPKESGTRKITVKIQSKTGEITLKNNSLSDYIKVLKNKRVISLFAGAPSPDVSYIKQYLNTLKGAEIREFIQSSGSEFFRQPTENDISETELFILAGFPISSTNDALLSKISKEISNGKPIFLITSLNTDFQKLKKIEEYLPFNTASSRAVEFSIIADVNPKSVSNALLRVDGTDSDLDKWKNLPPLFRTETFVRPKPESEVLATFKVNNVPLNEPLIISRNVNSKKSVAVIGYGLYRWKLVGYGSELAKGKSAPFDGFTTFMDNSLRWLSVGDINKKVSISTTKKMYSKGERVEIVAQVYDGAYLPVDNAIVDVTIKSGNNPINITLSPNGNGRYYGFADGLQPGDYTYSGTATRNSSSLGSDDGRFSIGEIDLEHRNIRMNNLLLKAISEASGGKYYSNENTQNLLDDIKSLKGFRPQSITLRDDFTLWNYPWLLVIAILLFSLEWIIRKRSGMI